MKSGPTLAAAGRSPAALRAARRPVAPVVLPTPEWVPATMIRGPRVGTATERSGPSVTRRCPTGGGARGSTPTPRAAPPARSTVGHVAAPIAAPVAANAWRLGVPVGAAAATLFAVLNNPGTPAENLAAGAMVLPFVVWAWRPV